MQPWVVEYAGGQTLYWIDDFIKMLETEDACALLSINLNVEHGTNVVRKILLGWQDKEIRKCQVVPCLRKG